MSVIDHVIRPKEKDLGDNFVVRRSLPAMEKKTVGPFVFWDHMGPATLTSDHGMKVRAHPHIGLATITWLFRGEIMHRDSLGNEQMIRPGEVNWMTAGRGIAHSERAQPSQPMELEGIQLWLALPKDQQEVEPSFVHHKPHELPQMEREGVKLTLIAGKALDQQSPVPVYSDLFYFDGQLHSGATYRYQLKPQQEGALYLTDGELSVEGQSFKRFDMVIFKPGSTIDMSSDTGASFMLFGGEAFPEKRHMWWNFVSTDPERIEQAKRDWSAGNFGQVINEDELIPLP